MKRKERSEPKITQITSFLTHRVTLIADRPNWIAVARLTSLSAGDLPVVLAALVTPLALHVLQARTLTRVPVAELHRRIGTQQVALTPATVLLQRVTVESILAELAVVALRVEHALQTGARPLITVAHVIRIDIVVAVALLAYATRLVWISVEVLGAHIAPGARVASLAVTRHVIGAGDQRTLRSVRMTGRDCVRTPTRPTADLTAQQRIAVVARNATVAVVAGRVVLARQALAGA
jgi:hypothetical protein